MAGNRGTSKSRRVKLASQRSDSPRQIMTDEARIRILEEKLAYQEHTIQALSDGLYRQQTAIDRLESQLKTLAEQLRTLSEAARITPEGSERPPHY